MSNYYDVVIVGAGAAGLAAARVFKKEGLSVKILEGSGAIGGRVQTRQTSSGKSYDAGAHWLHYGDLNIYKNYAEKLEAEGKNFQILPADDKYVVFNGQSFNPSDQFSNIYSHEWVKNFTSSLTKLDQNLSHTYSTRSGSLFRVANSVDQEVTIPNFAEYISGFALLYGNFDMGKDWDSYSNLDYGQAPSYEEGRKDYICTQGYGALISYAARTLINDISCETVVDRVRYDKDSGVVQSIAAEGESHEEVFLSSACIITCSTATIAQRKIKIDGLTKEELQAFSRLELGNYFRVILDFDHDIFEDYRTNDETSVYAFTLPDNGFDEYVGSVKEPVFVSNVAGSGVVFVDYGGSHAIEMFNLAKNREMDEEGNYILEKQVIQDLVCKLGQERVPRPNSFHFTWWDDDPLYLGAYSFVNAADQKLTARDDIKSLSPVDGVIYFAGEVMSQAEWGTVSGAHKEGCKTARKVLKDKFGCVVPDDDCSDLNPHYLGKKHVCNYLK